MFYIVFVLGLILAVINKKNISAKIFAALLILMAIFRYGLGADYFSYGALYTWTRVSVISEYTNPTNAQEVGFRLLSAFFKQLNLPYQIFLAFISIITIYFIYKISIKYTKNPTLSLLIYYSFYYFVWTLSALRQGIALSIGLYYMLEAIRDSKKSLTFIICAIILSFFHSSAILLIALFGFTKIKIEKKHLLILLGISFVFSFVPLGNIVKNLAGVIPQLTRISYYIDSSVTISSFLNFKTIARMLFLVIAFLIYDVYTKENPFNRKIINIYILSFIIYFFFKFSELTAARLAIYGKMLDIIIFCNVFYMLKRKDNKLIYVLSLFFIITSYFFKELNTLQIQSDLETTHEFYTPYVHIFNHSQYEFDNYMEDVIPELWPDDPNLDTASLD